MGERQRQRRSGGDLGASSGEGFYRYEKVSGPGVVHQSTLAIDLARPLFMDAADAVANDADSDGLVDALEDTLAAHFAPCVVFDRDEKYRSAIEVVTLLQVRKSDIHGRAEGTAISRLTIRWVFLFRDDGGCGPDSFWSTDAHPGDSDTATFVLESSAIRSAETTSLTWMANKAKNARCRGESMPRCSEPCQTSNGPRIRTSTTAPQERPQTYPLVGPGTTSPAATRLHQHVGTGREQMG